MADDDMHDHDRINTPLSKMNHGLFKASHDRVLAELIEKGANRVVNHGTNLRVEPDMTVIAHSAQEELYASSGLRDTMVESGAFHRKDGQPIGTGDVKVMISTAARDGHEQPHTITVLL